MTRRISRRRLLATTVSALSVAVVACGRPPAPTSPVESKPSATSPAVLCQTKPAAPAPTAAVQASGQATTKAPANKTRAGHRLAGRHLEARPAHEHVLPGHHRQLQPVRHADRPRSGPEADPAPRHRVEGDQRQDLGVQAPAGRQVPRRRSPLTSADVKFSIERTYDPNAKTLVATVFTTIEKIEAPDPHDRRLHDQGAGPAAAGAARLLRRPDHPEDVLRAGRAGRVQRQAGRQRRRSSSRSGSRTTASSSTPTRSTGAARRTSTRSPSSRSPRTSPGSRRCWPARPTWR